MTLNVDLLFALMLSSIRYYAHQPNVSKRQYAKDAGVSAGTVALIPAIQTNTTWNPTIDTALRLFRAIPDDKLQAALLASPVSRAHPATSIGSYETAAL